MAVIAKKEKRKSKNLAMDVSEESPKKVKNQGFVIDAVPDSADLVEKKKKKKKTVDSDEELVSPKKKQKKSESPTNNNNSGGGDEWSCACGHSNWAKRRNCEECREPNPSANDSQDWVCADAGCGASNFSSRNSCRICKSQKDGGGAGAKGGDWICQKCDFSNFASRFKCKQCNGPNTGSRPAPGKTVGGGKPGDWTCGSCSFSNFASRYNCKQCNAPGGGTAKAAGSFPGKPGDWACGGCGFSNFASRSECKKCNAPNSGSKVVTGDGEDWVCVAAECGFSNFASRFKCRQCFTPKSGGTPGGPATPREDNWDCNCGFSNFVTRTSCKSCGEKKSKSVTEHRVGMSHLSFDVTEDEIKQFFSPLSTMSIRLLSRDGRGLGKANVLFNSHEDAVTAMDKNGTDMGTWKVNLYLNSEPADGTPKKPAAPAKNKITFDEEPSAADETLNETAEIDASSSESPKKKFKWDKLIKTALKSSEDKSLSVKKLRKVLQPQYIELTGEEIGKEEFKEKLEERLNKSSKFTYENGKVSL